MYKMNRGTRNKFNCLYPGPLTEKKHELNKKRREKQKRRSGRSM